MRGNAGRPRFQAIVHSHEPIGETALLLHSFREFRDLGAVLFIGGRKLAKSVKAAKFNDELLETKQKS
jgi:hypothetical protein